MSSVVIAGNTSGSVTLSAPDVAGSTTLTLPNASGTVVTSANASTYIGGGASTQTASFTLTSSSNAYQTVNVNSGSVTCTLPNATTLSAGRGLFYIYNAGSVAVKINDNGGNCLGFVGPTKTGIVNLSDTSTANGTWNIANAALAGVEVFTNYVGFATNSTGGFDSTRAFKISATQDLITWTWSGATPRLYAAVYDSTTGSLGPATVIRTVSAKDNCAIALSSTSILLVSCGTTNMEAVVLSLSGTTITVNTAATTTLGTNISYINGGSFFSVGGGYVLSYVRTTNSCLRSFTVSGTTVTIGSETALATTDSNVLFNINSSVVLWMTYNFAGATYTWTPYTVSGTTLTAGTAASYAKQTSTSYNGFAYKTGGRFGHVYASSSSQWTGAVITVSGTTATATTVSLESKTTYINNMGGYVVGNQYIYGVKPINTTNTVMVFNVLTDVSGTATVGSGLPVQNYQATGASPGSTSVFGAISANQTTKEVVFYNTYQAPSGSGSVNMSPTFIIKVGVNGNNPTINSSYLITEAQGSLVRTFASSNTLASSYQGIGMNAISGQTKGIYLDLGTGWTNGSTIQAGYFGSTSAIINGTIAFVDILGMPQFGGYAWGQAYCVTQSNNYNEVDGVYGFNLPGDPTSANNIYNYMPVFKIKWTTL